MGCSHDYVYYCSTCSEFVFRSLCSIRMNIDMYHPHTDVKASLIILHVYDSLFCPYSVPTDIVR